MTLRFALIPLFAVTLATSMAHAEIAALTCLQTGPTEYKLSYTFTGDTQEVQILTSADPQATTGLHPLLTTHETTVTVHAGTPGQRMFFFLKPNVGEQREVSIRHLALAGTPNFRDIGGYETTDGRFVRWGLLYRSGVLTYLTPADMKYLGQAGIRVVCDFRTAQENLAAPELWITGADVQHMSLPIGGDTAKKNANAGLAELLRSNPTPDQLRTRMENGYRNFAFSSAPQYAQLFRQIETDHLPLLYHCTAGKDRTGVFTALLLLTLGVPEQTVLDDYSLTNTYLLNAGHPDTIQKMNKASGSDSISSLTPEQQRVLLAADPEYLRATLRAIDEKYGSFDQYRRTALHVSDADAQNLRTRLLMR